MVRLLGDDPFSAVCLCLDARSLDALRACGQRCRVVASADAAWRPRCGARWTGRRQAEAWLNAASGHPTAWRAAFVAREREIVRRRMPVFSMGAYLELGRRCDLHFFEPRYKWLVQEALHAHGGAFVFCTAAPVANPNSPAFSWVAEIRRCDVLGDGRANVSVVPVARCALRRVWRERVPDAPRAPPLSFADAEEVPSAAPPAAAAARFARLSDILAAVGLALGPDPDAAGNAGELTPAAEEILAALEREDLSLDDLRRLIHGADAGDDDDDDDDDDQSDDDQSDDDQSDDDDA
jgi:Lon protease-like protein